MSVALRGLVVAVILAYPATTLAVGAPAALRGKSVVLSWSEGRTQRPVGTEAWQTINNSVTLTVYISTEGRIFTRQQRTSSGDLSMRRGSSTGRERSNTRERAPGDAKRSDLRAANSSFQGNSLTLTAQYESGARQVHISFDGGLSSCTARVTQGREGGRNQVLTSQITGARIEVQSVSVSTPSCSVRAGNAFGE
jgi:hypothetical protein